MIFASEKNGETSILYADVLGRLVFPLGQQSNTS